MSLHNTIKSDKTSTSSEQSAKKVLSFPLSSTVLLVDTCSSLKGHDRFVAIIRAANPTINIDSMMDIIYESTFGHTALVLREIMQVDTNKELLEHIETYHPLAYSFMLFVEQAAITCLQSLTPKRRYIQQSDILRLVTAMADAHSTHFYRIAEFTKTDIDICKYSGDDDDDVPF